MNQYTFTMKATAQDVDDAIRQENNLAYPGQIIATIPWVHTRGYENVAPGDGAIIVLDDPEDKTTWLGVVSDVEFEDGYDMTVLIDVR